MDQELSNKRFFFYRKVDFTMNIITFFYLIALFYTLIYWFAIFVWLFRTALLLALVLGIIETIQANRFARQYQERDRYYQQLNQQEVSSLLDSQQQTSSFLQFQKRKQGAA